MSKHTPADSLILASYARLVEPLNGALPGPTEVVLHDLSKLPNSIIAIAGNLTGRRVGGPATDLLLRAAVVNDFSTLIGYETELADGRRLRSTTIVIRSESGAPMATLCINMDVTMWEPVRDFVNSIMPGGHWPGRPSDQPSVEPRSEHFASDIDALAVHLLSDAITSAGVPVDLMKKRHKIEVVRQLRDKGYFMLREAVDRCAEELQVTRFTVYNYLNELDEESPADGD